MDTPDEEFGSLKNIRPDGGDGESEGSKVKETSSEYMGANLLLPSCVSENNEASLSTSQSLGRDKYIHSFSLADDQTPRSHVHHAPKRQTSLQAPELERQKFCPIPELDSSEKEDSDSQNRSSILREVVKKELDHRESNLRFNRQIPLVFNPGKHRSKQIASILPMEANSLGGKAPKQPSKTLYVRAVDFDVISIEQLCNLFCVFGRVELGMVHLKHKYALIKMVTEEEAKEVIKALFGKYLGRFKLLIHYSQHQKFSEKFFSNDKVYHYPKWRIPKSILQNSTHLTSFLLLRVLKRNTWKAQAIPEALIGELLSTNLVKELQLVDLPDPGLLIILKISRSAIDLLLFYHFMELRSKGSVITLATLTATQADCLRLPSTLN
jgi:RNA recognition motif. (a.k.a. RRM, RBD, or RNP domain)